MTGLQLGLSAVLMNDDGGNRAVDLCLSAGHADLDQPMRRWYGTGRLAQPSEARRYPHPAISRLSGSDAEHVPDKIPGRGATPAVHRRTPAPALAEGVVAIDKELFPASDEVDQQLGPPGAAPRRRARHS